MTTMRNASVRNGLSLRTDHVAGATYGMQQRPVESLVNLRPQTGNMHVDDVCLRVEMIFPYAFKQHRSGHHLVGVAHKIFQQAEFARLKVDGRSVAAGAPGKKIELEVSHLQP